MGLALLFRLNKPLTLASTFINNPLLQPLIVVSSVELGGFLRGGSFRPFTLSGLTGAHMKEELLAWVIGSVALGVVAGGVGAAITAVVIHLHLRAPANPGLRDRVRFVNQMFARCARADRGFVRWKLRLDRIFGLLAAESLGSGTVVDLGCGYGMALAFAAFGDSSRRLVGCDLDAHRIAVAREAFSALNADLSVADVRHFELPPAGLILILDVLQYLPAEEQLALLKRCCSALAPQGRLIFRVHDRERGLWSSHHHGFRPTNIRLRTRRRPALDAFGRASTVVCWRTPVCRLKSAASETVCPWLISYSLRKNPWRRLRHDGPFHALGRPIGRRSSGVGDSPYPGPDLVLVCQHPQPAHRHRPDRPVW